MTDHQGINPYHSGRVYRIVWAVFGLLLAGLGIYIVFFGIVDLPMRIGAGLLITLLGANAVSPSIQSKPSWPAKIVFSFNELSLLNNSFNPMKITGRSSSITNAFINSIIPLFLPSAEEVKQTLEILEMTPSTFQCAYCGSVASEWDHLRPLIKDKKPTGYIYEIQNLVPSCGKCNQSKGNKEWKPWMLSTAKLSPTTRGIKDIPERLVRLEVYENSKAPIKMDFTVIV